MFPKEGGIIPFARLAPTVARLQGIAVEIISAVSAMALNITSMSKYLL
jgi:hypothetical protein